MNLENEHTVFSCVFMLSVTPRELTYSSRTSRKLSHISFLQQRTWLSLARGIFQLGGLPAWKPTGAQGLVVVIGTFLQLGGKGFISLDTSTP